MELLLLSITSWLAANRIVALYVDANNKILNEIYLSITVMLGALSGVSFVLGAIEVLSTFVMTLIG